MAEVIEATGVVVYEDVGSPISIEGDATDEDFLNQFRQNHSKYKEQICPNPNASTARQVEAEVIAAGRSVFDLLAFFGGSDDSDE